MEGFIIGSFIVVAFGVAFSVYIHFSTKNNNLNSDT